MNVNLHKRALRIITFPPLKHEVWKSTYFALSKLREKKKKRRTFVKNLKYAFLQIIWKSIFSACVVAVVVTIVIMVRCVCAVLPPHSFVW